jgi:hypothetical protein
VTLLEAFRVLVRNAFRPLRPVEMHWYAMEEVGLVGSAEIAAAYRRQNLGVYGMMEVRHMRAPGGLEEGGAGSSLVTPGRAVGHGRVHGRRRVRPRHVPRRLCRPAAHRLGPPDPGRVHVVCDPRPSVHLCVQVRTPLHSLAVPGGLTPAGREGCSDHASWAAADYPATAIFEAVPNPRYGAMLARVTRDTLAADRGDICVRGGL